MAPEPAHKGDPPRQRTPDQEPDRGPSSPAGGGQPAGDEASAADPPRIEANGAGAEPHPSPKPSSRLEGALLAIRRAPAEALAAAGIGALTLLLAVLAGDGGAEFPGPAFEAELLSQPPVAQGAELPDAAPEDSLGQGRFSSEALARRLVEGPVLDPEPLRDEPAAVVVAEPAPLPLDAAAGEAEEQAGGDRDPVAVLSAAEPRPADPVLRILERMRRGQPEPPSAAPPLRAPAGPASMAAAAPQRFSVQLVAVSRREQAERAWDRLRRENPDLLGRLQPLIAEPEPRGGALFRLRAGPLASAEEGRGLCASLASRGVECMVVDGG